MHGWVKLHRCLLEKNIFQNEKMLKVFMWCLMRANHKSQTVMVGRRQVDLQPGQFITGRKKASRELDMPPSTAWEYLKLLENNKTIDIYSDSKYSVVSVVNWASYQTDNQNSDSKPDSKSTANRQQIDTDKNVKNDKNDKNVDERAGDSEPVQLVVKKYNNNINPTITPTEYEGLLSWMDLVEPELIIWAIEQAVYQGVRRFSYLNKILIEMHKQGITTREQADAREKTRQNKGGNNGWGGMA